MPTTTQTLVHACISTGDIVCPSQQRPYDVAFSLSALSRFHTECPKPYQWATCDNADRQQKAHLISETIYGADRGTAPAGPALFKNRELQLLTGAGDAIVDRS